MTFTPIPPGTEDWDFPLNNALSDLQLQITTNELDNSSGIWTPEDNGHLAWTMDPYSASSSRAVINGAVQLHMISVKKAVTVNRFYLSRSAAGTSMTVGQNFIGLYDSTGALLGQTADQAGNFAVATTPLDAPLVVQTPIPAGKYWVGILANSTGSLPTFLGGPAGLGAHYNLGTDSSSRRLAQFGVGLTALPSSITPSSMTALIGNPLAISLA